jgi:hypothetical protein
MDSANCGTARMDRRPAPPVSKRGRHVILPGAGHLVEGMSDLDSCYDAAIVAFLDAADAAVDLACIENLHAPEFTVE